MRLMLVGYVALLGAQVQAQSLQAQPPMAQVEVSAGKSDVEAGRDFVAGKIVLGKKKLLESGVQHAGEFLAREPAITIGRDGRLGLLGLAGYTQVLVDGLPYQNDAFAIELIRIERIEIIKSSTAATGPVGIAGTINIILRKTERKPSTQVRIGGSWTDGRLGPDISLSGN